MKVSKLLATATVLLGFSNLAHAGLMTCTDSSTNLATLRTWSFNSADACDSGEGNPNSSADIEALGGAFDLISPEAWDGTSGSIAGTEGTTTNTTNSSLLTIAWTTGTFGGKFGTGTWQLAANFWNNFGKAVFTIHVGGGNHTALDDFGAFIITPQQYSGTWSFDQSPKTGQAGGGGGLSNFRVWTAGKGTTNVPEPGVLLMLGTALIGLGLSTSKRKV